MGPDSYTSDPSDGCALEVRRLVVLAAGDHLSRQAITYCHRDEKSLSLGECLLCRHCAGLCQRRDGGAAVFCRHEAARRACDEERGGSRWLHAGAESTPLRSLLGRQVICVRPRVAIDLLTNLLLDLGISGVPVVDESGHPIGVVSRTDVVNAGGDGTVADHMTPLAFTLPEAASVLDAATLMASESIHHVPVVAPDGRVVGVVSALDVMRWLAQGAALERLEDGC
jgi:CBS domain-containing protein